DDNGEKIAERARHGTALHAAGRRDEAQTLFADAEQRQRKREPDYPLLYALQGYQYCDLLLERGAWSAVCERATKSRDVVTRNRWLQDIALDELNLGRAALGLALSDSGPTEHALDHLDRAAAGLRASGSNLFVPVSLLARAASRRASGDWDGAVRDLDEV